MWSQQIAPNGKVFYLNSETLESVWTRPEEFKPAAPPPRLVDRVVEMKKIPGTTWAILLTSDDHEFFYDSEQQISVWDIPEEILHIIGSLLKRAAGESSSDEESEEDETELEVQEIEDDSVQVQNDEPELNKRKVELEPIEPVVEVESIVSQAKQATEIPRIVESPADIQKRGNGFRLLLQSLSVSPFSAWLIQEPMLAMHPEYIAIPTPKERKQIFEQYCRDMAVQAAGQLDTPLAIYKKLVRDMTNARTRYEDFARRFKRDTKFLRLDDEALRKSIFDEHIAELKRALRHNKQLQSQK